MNADAVRNTPIVAITQGDPAGIGPEIALQAVQQPQVLGCCRPAIIGDAKVLGDVAQNLKLVLPETMVPIERIERRADLEALVFPAILDCGVIRDAVTPGAPTRVCGAASYRYILESIRLAQAGAIDAVTTAPITKTTLKLAGVGEPGHTEIFGHHTGCENFAMMLYSPRIAVSFVTCHQSLRSVPDDLTTDEVHRVAVLTGRTLRAIRNAEPRLAVLGLNPHAGEGGLFGDEERRIIAPAVARLRDEGWNVEGPLSPDAAFMPNALKKYDGHVTLYHDQGSIPFKMISLHDGVNITMGLPIIRTSVDHGTAYDIAWRGQAGISSLISAIELAAKLARAQGCDGRDGRDGL